MDGLITDGERYNKVIDIWGMRPKKSPMEMLKDSGPRRSHTETQAKKVESFNPIYMMADSGARAVRPRSGSSPVCAV